LLGDFTRGFRLQNSDETGIPQLSGLLGAIVRLIEVRCNDIRAGGLAKWE
jgi:hypothetical protein